MTPQERLDHLLEDVSTPITTGVTLTIIENTLDSSEATAGTFPLVRLTIEAATVPQIVDGMDEPQIAQAKFIATRMADALMVLRSKDGLDLSPPIRQGMIDMLALAGQWPDAVRDAIKALGVRVQPRWQTEGYTIEPTLQSVTAEIAAEALAEQKQDWKSRFDAILNQIGTVEQADGIAALRAIADEMAGE
jgi:hypothetical protein